MGIRPRRALPVGAYRIQSSPHEPGASASPAPRLSANLRRGRRPVTLRVRLLIALVGVALLPLLATTSGGIYLARTRLQRQGQQVLLHRATSTASTIDNYLAGIRTSLVSASQEVEKLIATDAQLGPNTRTAIQDVLHATSVANNFTSSEATQYVATNGIVLSSDQPGDIGEDLSKSPTVQGALGGTYTVSGVAFDPQAPSDLRERLEAATPIYGIRGGVPRPVGVLHVRFSTQRFARWVQLDGSAQGGGILIEPDSGIVLAQSVTKKDVTFASIAPLPAQTQADLTTSMRYNPSTAGHSIVVHAIPGLTVDELQAGTTFITAGTFDGSNTSSMMYAVVRIVNAPTATPWTYLLATSSAALTASADQLLAFDSLPQLSMAQTALVILVVALGVSLATAYFTGRWAATWLTSTVQELGSTARAFLNLSNDQRTTAEEQRHRLTVARSSLQDLHRTASEVSEALERTIGYAEDTRRSSTPYSLPGQMANAGAYVQSGAGRWTQWAPVLRDRLIRQRDICIRLARDARITADTAGRMRDRGSAITTQASSLEATLWTGGVVQTPQDQPGNRAGSARQAAQRSSAGFSTGTLRLVLLGLLVAFGLLPSLVFATTSNQLVQGRLADQSEQAILTQAESRAASLDALLGQQQEQVSGLDTFYRSMTNPTSGVTPALVDETLNAATLPGAADLGTQLLELAAYPSGTVVASSAAATLNTSVANLSVFAGARTLRANTASTTAAYYDPSTQEGWYYIAAPVFSADQTTLIGVAIGKYSLAPVWRLLNQTPAESTGSVGTFTLVVERNDLIVLGDSRTPRGVFFASATLDPAALTGLWNAGRYPGGHTPPVSALPEVASAVRAPQATPSPDGFTGSAGPGKAQTRFWVVGLSHAQWDLVEALPVTEATAIADELTRYNLLLAVIVAVLTTLLALILGQSIIVPVRRLRTRFRDAARRLVSLTRRQDEAARRQEAVLPPIESTAQLLTLETEEVAELLFARRTTPGPGSQSGYAAYSPERNGGRRNLEPAPPMGYSPPSNPWAGAGAIAGYPQDGQGSVSREIATPSFDELRRARVLANDWGLRQQRILADLASALNATDQLTRASVDGQQEAAQLATLADELLANAR